MSDKKVRGRPPSPERAFWAQAIREIRKNSVKTLEETAKQIIALVTLLSGIYFHAITFTQVPKGYPDLRVLFVGPLALWALSLVAASLVFFPERFLLSPYDPDEAEQVITKALTWKYRLLMAALLLLAVSLIWLVVAAWVYLGIYVPGK